MSDADVKDLFRALEQVPKQRFRCRGGVENAIPESYGRWAVKAAIGFKFLDGSQELREGPVAWYGDDSIVTSEKDGCCIMVAVVAFVRREDQSNWQKLDPQQCIPEEENSCLTKNIWTIEPKRSIPLKVYESGELKDFLTLTEKK